MIYKLIGFIFFPFFLYSCEKQFTELDFEFLNGQVEKITVEEHEAEKRFGEWEPETLLEKRELIYNNDGLMKELSAYSSNGELDRKMISDLSEVDKKITSVTYDGDGSKLYQSNIYIKSPQKYYIEHTDSDSDTRLCNITLKNSNVIYEVHPSHILKKVNNYSDDTKIILIKNYSEETENNKDCSVLRELSSEDIYYEWETILSQPDTSGIMHTIEYDSKKNPTLIHYDDGFTDYIIKREYEYH